MREVAGAALGKQSGGKYQRLPVTVRVDWKPDGKSEPWRETEARFSIWKT